MIDDEIMEYIFLSPIKVIMLFCGIMFFVVGLFVGGWLSWFGSVIVITIYIYALRVILHRKTSPG